VSYDALLGKRTVKERKEKKRKREGEREREREREREIARLEAH